MKGEEKETKIRHGTVIIEKRKHPRFDIDIPIEYSPIDSSFSHTIQGLNISEGGLLLYFPEQMEIGQYIKLKLPLGSKLNPIEVLAEVVWMDIHSDKGLGDYRCGVNIVDISPEDIPKLKNYLSSLSPS